MKSHIMSFRPVPKSVTLNSATDIILRYFTEFVRSFRVYFVKVVEDSQIHSATEM